MTCAPARLTAPIPLDFRPSTPEELQACLADPMWRVCSGALYKIIIKGDEDDDSALVIPFRPNRAQRRLLKRLWNRNIILKARQLGFCLDPSTRVLTADLQWVPIGELQPGQEVVACDEHVPGGKGAARKMRTATVQAAAKVFRKAYRITFDDGRSVVCTAQHPWLTKKAGSQTNWRSLDGTGNNVVGKIKVGTKVRWVTKPWEDGDYEDGWFGGIIDGEGSMSKSSASGVEINVAQSMGPTLARMDMYLSKNGYNYRTESDTYERESKLGSDPVDKLCVSRMDEVFRLIGQTRPVRFIGRPFWEGKELPGKRNGDVGWATVTSIEELGEQTMIDLQTSTGTYIAEGFVSHNTTLICILFLDGCLFGQENTRAGIVAHTDDVARGLFRDKVKFAYDNLPPELRAVMPLGRDSADELLFAHNNASIRVSTSMRSGTLQYLHVSEFGKICARFPARADEVVTGSIPAVSPSGIIFIESTAEGRDGHFYTMTKRAEDNHNAGKRLSQKEYRFHFFPWWDAPEYRVDPEGIVITKKEHAYFDAIEASQHCEIDLAQRAWWISTRDNEFSGQEEMMWQEYPSTPAEAFQVSKQGCYYTVQMTAARKQGRITTVPFLPGYPVNTFWDIGSGDGAAVWFMQTVGTQHRFVKFIEGWGEPYSYFVKQMQDWSSDNNAIWGRHYLPHDGNHIRQGMDNNATPREMLEKLGLRNIEIVPRINELQQGIQLTRDTMAQCWFDETECKEGIDHLDMYRKKFNATTQTFTDEPLKDIHTEGADSFRQFAQALHGGMLNTAKRPTKKKSDSWRTA